MKLDLLTLTNALDTLPSSVLRGVIQILAERLAELTAERAACQRLTADVQARMTHLESQVRLNVVMENARAEQAEQRKLRRKKGRR